MDKKIFSLAVDVESLPFWIDRPVLRKRMRRLFRYIKKLETKLKTKDERIVELEAEYLNEKRIAAKAYTACGNYQQQIGELETDKENLRLYANGLENAQNLITVRFRGLENEIITMNDKCVKMRRDLEQKNKLLRIDLAEALKAK